MKKIIHITDTHIVRPGGLVVGLDPAARLLTVLDSVQRNHPDAALCVISGDLTDTGAIEEYQTLRDCLQGFLLPLSLMLGNHDRRDNFRSVFPDRPVDPHGFVQFDLDIGGWRLVLLDTKDDGHAGRGRLCEARMAWLEAKLTSSGSSPVLLFVHHPPASIGVPSFEPMLLAEGSALLDRLRAFPAVKHIAFGHIHMKASGLWRGISFSANRGTCHKIAPNFDGDIVDYVDAGPAYDVMLLGNDGTLIVHAVDPAGPMQLTAREYPTPDGVGVIELSSDPASQTFV